VSEASRRGRARGRRALLFLLGLAALALTVWLVVFFECKISG
jgi:hypothetical protein